MSGLVTMLVTVTRSPPSWVAMLPQKFSAATTEILPPCPGSTPEGLPHPPREAAITTGTAASPINLVILDTSLLDTWPL